MLRMESPLELINCTLWSRGPGGLACSTLQLGCVFCGQWCRCTKTLQGAKNYMLTDHSKWRIPWMKQRPLQWPQRSCPSPDTGKFLMVFKQDQSLALHCFSVSLYKWWEDQDMILQSTAGAIVISAAQQYPGCKVHFCLHTRTEKPTQRH